GRPAAGGAVATSPGRPPYGLFAVERWVSAAGPGEVVVAAGRVARSRRPRPTGIKRKGNRNHGVAQLGRPMSLAALAHLLAPQRGPEEPLPAEVLIGAAGAGPQGFWGPHAGLFQFAEVLRPIQEEHEESLVAGPVAGDSVGPPQGQAFQVAPALAHDFF